MSKLGAKLDFLMAKLDALTQPISKLAERAAQEEEEFLKQHLQNFNQGISSDLYANLTYDDAIASVQGTYRFYDNNGTCHSEVEEKFYSHFDLVLLG